MTDQSLRGGGDSRSKPPILLTKVDALNWAAQQLEDFARSLELTAIVLGAVDKADRENGPRDAETRAKLAEIRRDVPEPQLQLTAVRAGVQAIRDMALEERLVTARVEAKAGVAS